MALAFPVLFLPGEKDVDLEATSRRAGGCWRGYFVEHNRRTEEGDRLIASGVQLQGFMEAGVRPTRM